MAQTRPTQGVQVIEEALGAPPISTANFSAIGIAGTAPKATGKFLNEAKGIAYNQPFYITKRSDAADLGNEGTLPLALDSIFAQGSVGVVVIIVQDEKAPVFNLDDALYQTTWTGSNPAKVEFMITNSDKRIEFQSQNAHFDTDAANAVKALRRGQEITIDNNSGAGLGTAPVYRVTGTPGEEGTDANAVVYVPVEQTATTPTALTAGNSYKMDAPAQDGVAETQTNVIGNGSTFTGIWGFLAAGTEVGVTPRIIATPGIDNGTQKSDGTKNSLGAALETVAGKIRAIAIIDLPNDQNTVIKKTTGAAAGYSSDRTLLVSPAAKMAKPGSDEAVEFAMSGFIAGKIAVNDSEQGFWTPIGNKSLAGVLGLAVPVDFQMDNPNSGCAASHKCWDDNGYQLWRRFPHVGGMQRQRRMLLRIGL